jgi:hypothetical protein
MALDVALDTAMDTMRRHVHGDGLETPRLRTPTARSLNVPTLRESIESIKTRREDTGLAPPPLQCLPRLTLCRTCETMAGNEPQNA